jgi:FkbM family methyltransferase
MIGSTGKSALRLAKRIRNRFAPKHDLPGLLTYGDFKRVRRKPRFKHGEATFRGRPIRFSDGPGFLLSLREIFIEQVYKFEPSRPSPLIIDVGSNIGLSIIYFRELAPRSRIIAFEPDPSLFRLLEENIRAMNYDGIELHQSAAWIENTELNFYSEGSLAGSTEIDLKGGGKTINVKAERLHDFIPPNERVDFLKIDIEGAESAVLFDLAGKLENVDNLFIEYHSIVGKPQRLGEILSSVTKAGFRYSLLPAKVHTYLPFVERVKSSFDLQQNVFCFRC